MKLIPRWKRLACVQDACLLSHHPAQSPDATAWKCASLIGPGSIYFHEGGYTVTVAQNRFIAWHRIFTQAATPPPSVPSDSWLRIEEWIPGTWPNHREARQLGWRGLDADRCRAITWLHPGLDHLAVWSENTRRDLATFKKKPGIRLRFGTYDDVVSKYHLSQVPGILRPAFLLELRGHLAAHSDSMEILVAETDELGLIGCMVVANCEEVRQSRYMIGYFVPKAAKLQPMIGLMDWWFRRTIERGYEACDFGIMCGPNPLPWSEMIGYSNFKTRFGIQRIWAPKSYWRISFRPSS